jgi:hypothetical protein
MKMLNIKITNLIKHFIELKSKSRLVKKKILRYTSKKREFVNEIFLQMKKTEIITRIFSDWEARTKFSSKKKKSNQLRIIHNYISLNDCTIKMQYLVHHLQNRKPTENDESRLSSFSLVSRLSLNLSWVKRENVCQSTTIKWSIFDNIKKLFIIFVKNINFFTHNFVVCFNHFQKNASFINDNFFNIFVLCFFLDIDVSSTNFIVDVIDKFNVNLNDDVIYRISEESTSFKIFRNNANDVIIINNKIHLIIMNDAFVICFLNDVFIYTSKILDHCTMFNSSNFFSIYHYLSYILRFIVSIHIFHFLVFQRRFSQMRSNNDCLFIFFHSFFFSNYKAFVILFRSNIMFVLEFLKIFQRILFI